MPILLSKFFLNRSDKTIRFADPGLRRQDSAYAGLMRCSSDADLICIHDAARPFLQGIPFAALVQEASRVGAAALALKAVNTIKEADASGRIVKTLQRDVLWEMQTPQVIRRQLLVDAYAHASLSGIEATDDLSLIEALGQPASLIPGLAQNFKITTPLDWLIAERMIERAKAFGS